MQARAERAAALAHLGELSAASQALTAEPLAEGSDATLRELRDSARRPGAGEAAAAAAMSAELGANAAEIEAAAHDAARQQQMPISDGVQQYVPGRRLSLSWERFLANLRGARRGSAAGP